MNGQKKNDQKKNLFHKEKLVLFIQKSIMKKLGILLLLVFPFSAGAQQLPGTEIYILDL